MTTASLFNPTWKLLSLLWLAVPAFCAEQERVPIHVRWLELRDGKVLKDFTVTSFDSRIGLFFGITAMSDPLSIPYRAIRRPSPEWLSEDAADSAGRPEATPVPPDDAATVLRACKDMVAKKARIFYRYELKTGSDSDHVTAVNLDVGEPVPVDGWTGRFRTQGHAEVIVYDSPPSGPRQMLRSFEVVTELGTDNKLKLVEFIEKT